MSDPPDENDDVFVRVESSALDGDSVLARRIEELNYLVPLPGNETVSPLPEEVQHFLEVNIDSVDQLEILRVLGEDPEREWLAADLARETQTAAPSIATHLAVLQERGLLVLQMRGADLFCRYGPNTQELAERAARLLQVYRERPVTMIKLVYASARAPLKTFADAFRLKKEG